MQDDSRVTPGDQRGDRAAPPGVTVATVSLVIGVLVIARAVNILK